jgi:hypothetical protein
MTAKPRTGTRYTYNGDTGLGAAHADRELASEHAELDMQPGTAVSYTGYDDDRDLVLVEWADAQGNQRITSVEPEFFAASFTKG